MNKKYQVFVSSTYDDLKDERDQVIKAILEMGHIPVGMEMFSAADEQQWKVIARTIDEIDYYIVIVAHRYGSVTRSGVSYTEKEFAYAHSRGIPILGFVIDPRAAWPADRMERDTKKAKKLAAFKRKVKQRLVQSWTRKEDLQAQCSIALMKAIASSPRTGWARASDVPGPEVMTELSRLSSENAALREEVAALRKAASDRENDVTKAIRVLSKNRLKVFVRETEDWNSAVEFDVTLADIFHYVAPSLISELSSHGVAKYMALRLVGGRQYKVWPVGTNKIAEVMADLAALDLVEPSKRKHSVSDPDTYWSLTKLGKRVLQEFRRVRLEEGLPPAAAEPAAGSPSPPSVGKA